MQEKKRERGYKKAPIEGTQTRIAEGFLPPRMTIQNKIPNFPKTIHKVKKHPPAIFYSFLIHLKIQETPRNQKEKKVTVSLIDDDVGV